MLFVIKHTGQPNRSWYYDGSLIEAKNFSKKSIQDPKKATRIYNPRGKLVSSRPSAGAGWKDTRQAYL